jgi:membrane-associated phospholipid phosphatase
VAAPCALIALLYVLAVGTGAGRGAEDAVFVNPRAVGDWVADAAIGSVDPWLLAALTMLAAVVVARRDGVRTGVALLVLVVGANVSTFVLERVLDALDPVGGEAERTLGPGYFPSGHATAAMSVACAVIAAGPARWAWPAALAGGAWVAVVGVALTAPANHHASDVIAGLLVVVAWVEVAHAIAGRDDPGDHARMGATLPVLSGVLAAIGGVLTPVAAGLDPLDHGELVVASALVIWTALIVTGRCWVRCVAARLRTA